MSKKRYEAFTLIEMLVVMGILIILMVVGIAAGRFALFRAADVAHRNAADQVFEGLQAYFVDNRAYPQIDSCGETGSEVCNPANLMVDGPLTPYLDIGAFNGGSAATFLYFPGGDNFDQAALVCVSMRGLKGINDGHSEGAYYCSGNAFGQAVRFDIGQTFSEVINSSLIETDQSATTEDPVWRALRDLPETSPNAANWDNQEWQL